MPFEHPVFSSWHYDTLFHFFDEQETLIHIHLNKMLPVDDARIAFVLHALARGVRIRSIAGNNDRRQSIIRVCNATLRRVRQTSTVQPERLAHITTFTVLLFGMRIFQLLGEEYDELVDLFALGEHAQLYSEPVLMSTFMAAYAECTRLRERMPYAESMWYRALHVFDFLLHSSAKDERPPFDFTELSGIPGIPQQLAVQAASAIAAKIEGEYLHTGSSSGIANCVEHFIRVCDDARARRCLDAVAERTLARGNEYLSTDLRQDLYADRLFREHGTSQYVCLDTNAHLLHAFINSIERSQSV